MAINYQEYTTLQEAWEGLNEYMCKNEKEVLSRGGVRYGPELVSYRNMIKIERGWVDPKFNFGYTFGYHQKKWTSLINNYIDFNQLDLVRAMVLVREKKSSKGYNYAFRFSNHHGSGKDCLISIVFSRRPNDDIPTLIFNTRNTELTKRLIFDFLLIQRIGQYIYGDDAQFRVEFYCPTFYITAESVAMYHNHRSLKKIMKKVKNKGTFQKRILTILKRFRTWDPDRFNYQSEKRAVLQLQKGKDGKPISGKPDLFARDCALIRNDIDYPEDCITMRQRKKYLRKIKK